MVFAMKLFGPLETVLGFVVYYFLQSKYGAKAAFWIALVVTILSTVIFGMYLQSSGI